MNWHTVMMKEPLVVSPQLRYFSPDILDVSALRDNASDSLFAPDVRSHDAQHPQWEGGGTVNMIFMFNLTRRTFSGLGKFLQPTVKTAPTSYKIGTGGSFLGVKQQGREADHSPPTSAEVKKMWIYKSTPLYVFMA
jgi:hypothetical protein